MFMEALFIVAKKWKLPKCPSSTKWISYTHRMKYYVVIKRSQILISATTWMNLENIMLSGRRQSQKETCYVSSII